MHMSHALIVSSYDPYCACFFSHSSGVKHLGVQACIAAISSFNAELTRRCRARLFFFSNSGDTIIALNAWPQPPEDVASIRQGLCRESVLPT